MKEQVARFGHGGGLTGILTEPEPRDARSDVVVLSSNVGIHHHVGPNRFNVDLSRALASRGVASLRFDQSGFGDSTTSTDPGAVPDRAVDDHLEAMRFLQSHRGTKRFVAVGFCSSVDPVHRLALADDRVVGVCFIEGCAYRTNGFFLRYPLRYLDAARWRRLAARRLPRWTHSVLSLEGTGRFAPALAGAERPFARDYPRASSLRADYEAMGARGTRQLFVYVGGDSDFNHQGQFLEFTGLPSLGPTREVVYLPDADHTFFQLSARAQVIDRICRWAERDAS